MIRLTAFALSTLTLGACMAIPLQTAPVAYPVAQTAAPAFEPAPAQVTGIAGLQSREPDACHAGDYRHAMGQPGTAIASLGVKRDYRIVEYRGIEPPEYDPLRIVFRLDAAGNVQTIDCG
ncbi:hypothetical protein [Paracoccus alkenifer]|uniref:Peptidase inhibitor I78 family protein n=1 Tax=Paracoccus alkenifer TaxID=65735 RepID=A0A1H6M2J1_9RHOB|nr:hypothetical protein [Paracoccus alkenifer]SEH95369.1 hypothetical protein SAMN04488075_1851 [Paracoccus alkenifer]